MHFSGWLYVLHFVIPQFLFHVTTAYDIAWDASVPFGKLHYLGTFRNLNKQNIHRGPQ